MDSQKDLEQLKPILEREARSNAQEFLERGLDFFYNDNKFSPEDTDIDIFKAAIDDAIAYLINDSRIEDEDQLFLIEDEVADVIWCYTQRDDIENFIIGNSDAYQSSDIDEDTYVRYSAIFIRAFEIVAGTVTRREEDEDDDEVED